LGGDGVFAHVEPQTVILEMSTISPGLSALLHQEAAKHGANLIDLPVSGSTPAVEAGTVTLFGGGEQEIFNRCIPIFESIARHWHLMGPATAGIQMKLVVNLLLGINMEAIAEARPQRSVVVLRITATRIYVQLDINHSLWKMP
jgi:3-hydroxyisobutyrate dehydrogenase-like beta-hydroxyacid dehydrogenase